MDWEKAKRRSLASTPRPGHRKQQDQRQKASAEFVLKHDLCCFKCGGKEGPSGKTGVNKRGPGVTMAAIVLVTSDTTIYPNASAAGPVPRSDSAGEGPGDPTTDRWTPARPFPPKNPVNAGMIR
jgi:hypothetical protein